MPKKIAAAERMLNLLALLAQRTRPITLKQIRAELVHQYSDKDEAARAQFERDKAELREMGIVILTETLGGDQAGETAYRVDRRSYELSDAEFTQEELMALHLAASTVHLGAQEGETALWKLGAERANPKLAQQVTIPFTDPHLAVIMGAIADRAPLSFDYKGEQRKVDAYGMLSRKGFWYLIGFDHLRDAQRVFRVDRIDGVIKAGKKDSYKLPKGLDIAKMVPTDTQMMAAGDYEYSVAVVRVDASEVRGVTREFGAGAIVRHYDDGSADFEVPCSNSYAFRLWLFAMVDKAVVVSPPEVRDLVMGWLDELAGVS